MNIGHKNTAFVYTSMQQHMNMLQLVHYIIIILLDLNRAYTKDVAVFICNDSTHAWLQAMDERYYSESIV